MGGEHTSSDCPDAERCKVLWLAVRQGLLLIVGAIERAYGLRRSGT